MRGPGPRLETTEGGLTVFFGRYLYSPRDPRRRPRMIASSAVPEGRCLYMVTSPLLGYGLDTLLKRIPDDSHVIAVEVSPELFSLCRSRVEPGLLEHPRLSWVQLSDEAGLSEVLDGLGLWRFRRIRRVELSGGSQLNADICSRLVSFAMDSLAAYWRNRHALRILGRHWVRHFYANLANMSRCRLKPAPGLRIGKIPVVVGAGPSLDEGFDFVVSHRSRLSVWASDTALGALLQRGIEPDIVCALETQAWNHLDFHDSHKGRFTLLADMTCYPPTLEHAEAGVELFTSLFARLDFLDRVQGAGLAFRPIPPLGSVGLAAVHLALELSSLPVLLLGLDFAYSPGKTHARGSSVHRWQLSTAERTDPLPGWQAVMGRPRTLAPGASGRPVPTDTVLTGYASLLRNYRSHPGSSGRIYVLGGGGLNLGFPVLSRKAAAELVSDTRVEDSPAILRGWGAAAGAPGTAWASESGIPSGAAGAAGAAAAAERFLVKELENLQSVIDAWDAYASGSGRRETLRDALRMLDHVYCDFPDAPPLPRDDDSFLVRAVTRCRELKRYISRLINS